MQNPQKNRATELEKICIELKELAYELDIAIIITSKLKDPINNSSKQHPSIYPIKDSKAIEHILDSILLLYIPSYFDCEAYNDEGNLLLNKLIITIHNKDKIHSVTLNTVFSENRITDLVIAQDIYDSYMEINPLRLNSSHRSHSLFIIDSPIVLVLFNY